MLNSLIPVAAKAVRVHQVHEVFEWLGFETRNKYEILSEGGESLGFAAEQRSGFVGAIFRNIFGHWRRFDIQVFNPAHELVFKVSHPFRFFFQRMEVRNSSGSLTGAVQQRFAIFSKCFDIENAYGQILMRIRSPIWSPWTFPVARKGKTVAHIRKKWSGAISEIFTDRDDFLISFDRPDLIEADRHLILAAALFVDLNYFERKAGK